MNNPLSVHPRAILIPGLILLTSLLVFNYIKKKLAKNVKNVTSYPPEPPGAWPVIGHLPLLNTRTHIAHPLSKLADKLGPVFTLRLGMQRVVVVSSREAVMECFTANDKLFVNRPKSSAGEHLVYNNASFGFSNGPYWREMRKLVMLEVLSPRRLESMRNLRVSEICTSIRELYLETKVGFPVRVTISRWIEQLTLNIIVRTVAGIRYGNGSGNGEVERFRGLFRELTFLSGEFVLSDVIPFPFLKMLDLQGYVKRMKRVAKELDAIIEKWIDEHVQRRGKGGEGVRDQEQDFIDVMLSTLDDKFESYGVPRRTIIKATVVNVVLGGFDTMSVYLSWLLALLINHKKVLNQAQQEIESKIGKQKWVQESDIKDLPYLQSIISEALRLYPPLPLSIPHEAVQDCHLSGYFIPKGTLLFVNLFKLHRDPRFWSDPDRFMPERFFNSDALGQQFEFIPFGSGRRSCPGITFAMHVTNLTIARLIQGFDFDAPGGSKYVDMSEGVGITMPRANALEVMLSPRLDSRLYEN
ncbi:hypothetical protein ACJIZ3_012308 [Penstemon smallii]|uniref:Flavonoid-6-hydroxylase n=1 Tax=Penstemon smallii TaxID=265156 RepID=A0ABD3UNT0_9LAMI